MFLFGGTKQPRSPKKESLRRLCTICRKPAVWVSLRRRCPGRYFCEAHGSDQISRGEYDLDVSWRKIA